MAQAVVVLLLASVALFSSVKNVRALPLSDSLHLWDMFNLNDTHIQQLRLINNFIVENHLNIGELLHLNTSVLQSVLRPLHEKQGDTSEVHEAVPKFGEHVLSSVAQIGDHVHEASAATGGHVESAKLDTALHLVKEEDAGGRSVVHTAIHHKLLGSNNLMPWPQLAVTWTDKQQCPSR